MLMHNYNVMKPLLFPLPFINLLYCGQIDLCPLPTILSSTDTVANCVWFFEGVMRGVIGLLEGDFLLDWVQLWNLSFFEGIFESVRLARGDLTQWVEDGVWGCVRSVLWDWFGFILLAVEYVLLELGFLIFFHDAGLTDKRREQVVMVFLLRYSCG